MSGPKCLFDEWTEEQKQEALAKMIEIAQQGGHQSTMCVALGLKSEDTFYRWKREIPEFKAMCDEAKMHAKAFYESMLLKGGLGLIKGFNTAAIMSIVNAKFADEYRPDSSSSNQTNNTFNILSIGKDELKLKVQEQLQHLQQLGIDFNESKLPIDVEPS